MPSMDLQGHRGARGLRPENTLPSFEAALDACAGSLETDLHLSRDGEVVLCHDPFVAPPIFTRRFDGVAEPNPQLLVRSLSVAQLRGYSAAGNPNPLAFPLQKPIDTPLALLYQDRSGLAPYSIPTLGDLFAFVAAYASTLGEAVGKTAAQRHNAAGVVFDLELKRIPFFPGTIGDDFDGGSPGLLERRVVEVVCAAGLVQRTRVRSFDHRAVRAVRTLESGLVGAVLIGETAPVDPAALLQQAGAGIYCPSHYFLDRSQVQKIHAVGGRVLPWTVNDPAHWERLLNWGVDGLTTDYPDRLAAWLQDRGVTPATTSQ